MSLLFCSFEVSFLSAVGNSAPISGEARLAEEGKKKQLEEDNKTLYVVINQVLNSILSQTPSCFQPGNVDLSLLKFVRDKTGRAGTKRWPGIALVQSAPLFASAPMRVVQKIMKEKASTRNPPANSL